MMRSGKMSQLLVKLNFHFLTECIHHLQSYLLQQTLLKLVNWFQRYGQVEGLQKQQKTRQMFPFNWLYLKISICTSIRVQTHFVCSDHIQFH